MSRRILPLFISLMLVLAACGNEVVAVTTTQPTTTTTEPPTTTTTIPTTTTTEPLSLEGAPADLVELVDGFYDFALGANTEAPPMPEPILASIQPADGVKPTSGVANVAAFNEDRIATVEVGSDLLLAVDAGEGWKVVGGEWPSLTVGAHYGSGPRHLAVIGSDARPGEPMDQTRADSIHFVALSGDGGAAVVGLPRDSYIPVPGLGTMKITNSLALGGVDSTMAAFSELTDLPLEGYVLTGFSGFQSLIDGVLGGVEVEVPFAINDEKAKAVLSAGLQILNGYDALGFARARKTLPGGDFTRSKHQGVILIGAAKGVRAMGVGAIPALMEMAEPYIKTDLTAEQLLTFSVLAIKSDLDSVESIVAPGSAGRAGSASVVYLHNSADDLFADLVDGRLGE